MFKVSSISSYVVARNQFTYEDTVFLKNKTKYFIIKKCNASHLFLLKFSFNKFYYK